MSKARQVAKWLAGGLAILLAVFLIWQFSRKAPLDADWPPQFAVPSIAEFNGDLVTIRNVRNFRYGVTEKEIYPNYYDRTYDLRDVKRVWFIAEPFNEMKYAAHTLLSFEFGNGDFLAVTIEARRAKGQIYDIWKGMMRSYPIIYIAADERDAVQLRASIRKDNVYAYPVKLAKPENARILLEDMLKRMNKLYEKPEWYNTLWTNCTSEIAWHVNRVSPKRISPWAWQLFLTSSADELALKEGLLDTSLSIEDARAKYRITSSSLAAGDVPDYSRLIREGFE